MKARLIFAVLGLMGMAVGSGCSEKQRETARLEAAMKRGDTLASESPNSIDTVPRIDTVKLVSVSDTVPLAPEKRIFPEEEIIESIAAPVELEATTIQESPAFPRITDSVRRIIDSPKTSIEPVLDAGAIPDEERMRRQSVPTVSSDQSTQPAGIGYVIQICSTPDQKEANTLVAKYIRNGYHAFVMEAFIEGTTYFRVRIGRYDSVAEAEGVLSEMNQKFGVSGFVAQVK